MKISREQLLLINSLRLNGIVNKMSESQFDEYCKSLDLFVESLPTYESKLIKSLESKDMNTFSATLLTILDILTKIHATGLAQLSLKLLGEARTADVKTTAASLTEFLSSASAMSIDIQMAQHKDAHSIDIKEVSPTNDDKPVVEKTILAVDDISFLLNALKTTLQSTPYKFTGVTSGAAALRYLDSHTPDLFILDIEMPEMNGYELAQKIKARGHKAPIIFLTGNATKEYVLKAIQVGSADFIVKPVSKNQVLEKIEKFLG